MQRYEHHHLEHVEFSPHEEYLMTHSTKFTRAGPVACIKIFHTLSGKLLRQFDGPYADFGLPEPPRGQPAVITSSPLKWLTEDGKDAYFTKIGPGVVSVYEAPSMMLLDNQSIRLEGLKSMMVCPEKPVIACFQVGGPFQTRTNHHHHHHHHHPSCTPAGPARADPRDTRLAAPMKIPLSIIHACHPSDTCSGYCVDATI